MSFETTGRYSRRRVATGALAALFVAACGGGGGGIADAGGPNGAIDGGGVRITSGPINGFGSIIVNGQHYDTSAAEILVDGAPASEQDLEVGQVVVIAASDDGNGGLTAERVVYEENVEGPIDTIDLVAETLVVLGQTVLVNAGTSFDDDIPGGALDGLAPGDYIEVSGHVDSAGRIVATRIELEDGTSDLEVTGLVTNLDAGAMTFTINDLTVDYSQATLEDFEGGEIGEGDLVEAEGTQLGPDGELIANRVERKDEFTDDDLDDAEIEIEGLITRFVSGSDFDVAGVAVTTNAGTEFEDGSVADLALDVLVEVEGAFDANGVLVADEVDFEDDGPLEIEAAVDGVDTAAGEIVLLGITVEVDPETRMEDNSDLDLRPFSIDDIAVGDWLEVRGFETETGSGILRATRLERDDPDGESSIRGIATDVVEPSFRILGLDIDTDAGTQFESVERATFFATAEGRLVEAEGNLNGERFIATEVELEEGS